MLGPLVDRLLKKTWSDEDVEKYVGRYRSTGLTFARDADVRQYAASGGTTSALLLAGLRSGRIEGAVVCHSVIVNGKVRSTFAIATSEAEILAARGSKYVETSFLREVLPLIRAFDGRLAVVGLPCDISALERWKSKDSAIGERVAVTIALVCGHNSRTELVDRIAARLERQAGAKLTAYRFRYGHWRGRIEATFANGRVLTPSYRTFSEYRNLFFFCERKCMACNDHYGYDADISTGDVWLQRLKRDPIKKTGLIVRTEAGEALLHEALAQKAIVLEPVSVRDIMDGQSRIGPSHYNVSARAKVGRHLGLSLKDTVRERVTWHARLNAFLTIANMQASESALGQRLIFATPRPLLKAYLYVKKGLETLR